VPALPLALRARLKPSPFVLGLAPARAYLFHDQDNEEVSTLTKV